MDKHACPCGANQRKLQRGDGELRPDNVSSV